MARNRLATELVLSREKLLDNHAKIQGLIDRFPEKIPTITVDEYAEQHRVLPPGTPYPGPWRNSLTPYATEIMRSLSARSLVQEVIWIKCSQIGATAVVENFLAYIISQVPGPTLYCTSVEALLKKWVNKRLSPLLISCGLEDRVQAQHLMKNQRRTGNQMLSKEFPGGSLDMVSAQSEHNLRQDTIRYLVLDEAGAYPWNIQGFGDPIEIARARTANYRSRRKIFIPSTPGLEGECRMWMLYLEGDQRRYFVPCPHCGAKQVLRFPSEPEYFYEGFASIEIQWETKAGILDKSSIHFDCHKCGGQIFERHREQIVSRGEWIPTAQGVDDKKRSYQIGRIYSLMDDWDRLVKSEIKGQSDPLALQAHHNHVCGIPHRATAAKIDKNRVYELRGTYQSGTLPSEKILFLTAAVDVQPGSDNDPDKPPRLEMEVCGHGARHRTWSILYKTFEGRIDDAYDGAWEELYHWFSAPGTAKFRRADGFATWPVVVFIDSGYTENKGDTTVFDFCSRLNGFFPIKGFRDLKQTKQGHDMSVLFDEANRRDMDRFRLVEKDTAKWVDISTNWYKRQMFRALQSSLRQKEVRREGANYCDFPSDYPDKYFDMLVAEEERADHTFFRLGNRPNEALDLRVYNLAASDFYIWLQVKKLRENMRRRGYTAQECKAIYAVNVLRIMEEQVARKDVTPQN